MILATPSANAIKPAQSISAFASRQRQSNRWASTKGNLPNR
jgi:hypothetical protein